jgi:hypothetical protein
MRFRGMSITMVGAITLLALATTEADAQRGRIGVLRSAPRPSLNGARPRLGFISPHFFTSCFIAPSFSPFFPFFGGGVPFVNIQLFADGQPSPDPSSHIAPDPNAQPVPIFGSHPVPGLQPVPEMQPVPGAPGAQSVHAFATPVYSTPVYTAPVYVGAAPMATPQVSGGMVVGDVIDDPTLGLPGSWFFGGGIVCIPTRFLDRSAFSR